MMRKLTQHESPAARADELFQEQQRAIYVKTDRLFAKLMGGQWIACIAMAIVIAPYTWNGETKAIHAHVWTAIFAGGAISLFPIWLTRVWPGAAITRYVIAVAQMLMSALLISVTGGRIETHFHVFGSLVILSFYRDWRVLVPATIVVGLDHFIRGVYYPYSVYGVLTASPWRSIEHAAWVVFEDVFLVISCFRSIREMRAIANHTAALEMSEQNFRQIFQEAPIGMAVVGLDEKFLQANAELCQMLDYSEEELQKRSALEVTHAEDVDFSRQFAKRMLENVTRNRVEKRYVRKDGQIVWASRTGCVIRDEAGNPRHFLIMIEDISKQKHAEEALHESKRELEAAVHANQLIMDHSQDVICTVDDEGRFLSLNAACEQLWGYKPDEMIGRRYREFVHSDDQSKTNQAEDDVRVSGSINNFINRYVRKDGSLVDVLWSASWSEAEKIFFAIAHDITKRKRDEEEIRQLNQSLEQRVEERTAELLSAEERYRSLFERNPEPMWVFDRESLAFLEVNEAAIRHYGYTREEFLGRTLKDIRPAEDIPAFLEGVKKSDRGAVSGVWRHRRKDGSDIDVAITANDFEWNGRPARLVLALDITERKRAEDAIRAAEQKYRAIFENSIEGIFQSTPEGKFISVNPAMARIHGYDSPEDLICSVTDISKAVFVDPERRLEFKRLLETQGSVELFEYEAHRKDGTIIWLSENARAVRDANGEIMYYEGSVEDVTEQKRVKEVERASKAKSEFLSRMSHELRTPLNAILGFGQLLDRQKPTPVQKNRIGHILSAGRHLLNLINEVLDIARVESGRFQLSLEPVLVEHAVDEAIELIRPLAAERKVEIQKSAALESHPSVLADQQRLKQVLLNVFSNAVKYNRKGGRVIVDLVPQDGGRFRISVSDEGPGIPPDKRARLFSPFDRLGAENSDAQGTGLGLALSKRLTEAMGGTIGEGGPALGACFWVEFPIVKSVQEQAAAKHAAPLELAPLNGDEKTLLYIEDNLSNLSLIEQLIGETTPIKLISAMQGQLGLELATRHQPDLILLDIHLPDINGADVLARLKARPRTRDIPVVVLSADATRSQIDRLMSLGADDYLTKPLDVECFFKVLEEHFCEPSLVNSNGNGA